MSRVSVKVKGEQVTGTIVAEVATANRNLNAYEVELDTPITDWRFTPKGEREFYQRATVVIAKNREGRDWTREVAL